MNSMSVFLFKQKTAYEMRISDWSSDVCSSDLARPALAEKIAAVAAGAAVADVITAIDHIGNPTREGVDYARTLLSGLPAVVKEAVREPYGARAVIYCLALDAGQEVRAGQLKRLHDDADPNVYAMTLALLQQMDELDIR